MQRIEPELYQSQPGRALGFPIQSLLAANRTAEIVLEDPLSDPLSHEAGRILIGPEVDSSVDAGVRDIVRDLPQVRIPKAHARDSRSRKRDREEDVPINTFQRIARGITLHAMSRRIAGKAWSVDQRLEDGIGLRRTPE